MDGRAIETNVEKGNDNMSVRAATFDRDGKELGEALVDERACDCCPTAVAMTAAGPVPPFCHRGPDEGRAIFWGRPGHGEGAPPTRVAPRGRRDTAAPAHAA